MGFDRSEKNPSSVRGYYTFRSGFLVEAIEDMPNTLMVRWRHSSWNRELSDRKEQEQFPRIIEALETMGLEVSAVRDYMGSMVTVETAKEAN